MHNNPRSVKMHLQEEKVTVPSTDKVELETRLYRGAGRKQTCVILTHPYGPLGGNFENNVVQALFDNFASQGFMTVRFNFRGAGRSTGRTSFKGAGEADDVLSICRYVRGRPEIAPTHIILCGYSYGSVAAGAITRQVPELAGFISISYPRYIPMDSLLFLSGSRVLTCWSCDVAVLWFLTFFGSNKLKAQLMEIPANLPKLFICGNRDNFTSEANFKKFVDELPNENKTVVVVNEATHFWNEMEQVLVAHVNQWMGRNGLNSKTGKSASAAALKVNPAVVATSTVASKNSPTLSPASPWSAVEEDD
ncbi:hypothetical protein PhCBS80983_g00812 [Powellomyces hirtus]|uniref:Xaa-Pro dipeptidyl-peptidase-like domain-containing protein n=1 Tax=Powellomyces hirtus TaxID=109895 RepID=A0A507EFH9_9FUNG|nr:hypothetical protein PhCBS80983_g00812 [Powellomyces hirtus]